MEECSGHTECKVPGPPKLPRRVIMVAEDTNALKLLETNNLYAEYIALSYCWGGPQESITIRSTLDDRLTYIDESALSQTIRDAVKVARELGFRYLWIDALCIIQDCKEDKILEIAKMHQYYHHASLTLVAASPVSAQDGFLRRQTAPACIIPYHSTDGRSDTLHLEHLVHDPDSYPYKPTQQFSTELRNPTARRAWTLQEDILSPRKLIYGARCIDWACRHHGANMSGNGRFKTAQSGTVEYDPPRLNFFSTHPSPSNTTAVNSWWSIVAEYSSRFLTDPEDKLLAISAVAQAIRTKTEWTYLAGLWAETFSFDLLWSMDADNLKRYEPTIQPARNWRAPSWSWACMDGRIETPAGADVQAGVCRLVGASVLPQDLRAPYGNVKPGSFVDIYGKLRNLGKSFQQLDEAEHTDLRLDSDTYAEFEMSALLIAIRDNALRPQDNELEDLRSALQSLPNGHDEARACIEQLILRMEYSQGQKPEAVGLLLCPISVNPKVYHRLGIFLSLPLEDFDDIEPSVIRIA